MSLRCVRDDIHGEKEEVTLPHPVECSTAPVEGVGGVRSLVSFNLESESHRVRLGLLSQRVGDGWDSSSPLSADPRWCRGSTPDFESGSLGSTPDWGAMIPVGVTGEHDRL